MADLWFAVDPGANGGLAWRRSDWEKTRVDVLKMPGSEPEISKMFQKLAHDHPDCTPLGLVEDVGYHIKGNNAASSVVFAQHCGYLRGVLDTLFIAYSMPQPKAWMKALLGALPHLDPNMEERKLEIAAKLRTLTKEEEKALEKLRTARRAAVKKIRKNAIKEKVQRLYPKTNVTLWSADAIGILHAGLYTPGIFPMARDNRYLPTEDAVPPPPPPRREPDRTKPRSIVTMPPPPPAPTPVPLPASLSNFLTL